MFLLRIDIETLVPSLCTMFNVCILHVYNVKRQLRLFSVHCNGKYVRDTESNKYTDFFLNPFCIMMSCCSFSVFLRISQCIVQIKKRELK